MVRTLNILLLMIALVGAFFAWYARSEYDATRRQHARLTAKVGRLPIKDATKVHVRAFESDNPLEFKWQIHVPAGFNGEWRLEYPRGSSSSMGTNQRPRTAFVRVRFRKIDGQWHMWSKHMNGSSIVDVKSGELLEHPESLRFQQFGKGEVKVLAADQVATLLKITTEQGPLGEEPAEPLLNFRLGSRAAWAKQRAQGK